MSSAKVLVIFEGEQPEENAFARLQKAFPSELSDLAEDLVKIVFSTNIYALYSVLKQDEGFLDVVEVLKERLPKNKSLQDLNREDVSQIYLFFDLDIHGKNFSPEISCKQLSELVDFFDNETENGKLFLSYPMVEAVNICDIENGLMSEDRRLFKIEDCQSNGFKRFAGALNRDSKTICRANGRKNWNIICKANYEKAQWLMERSSEDISSVLEKMNQSAILRCQQNLITREAVVATLSAFPFFLLEYLGARVTNSLILQKK